MLMKKKFIFLAMMLLTLLGGAKFNVLNAQTQYRVKFPTLGDYYLTIFNNVSHPSGSVGGVGVDVYQESNAQKFTIETGANGGVYLKSADGYYIYCNGGSSGWNVDAINSSDKSELYGFDMTGGSFKIYDDNGYIKVQEVNSAYYIFHDASSSLAASWQLEEVATSGEGGEGGEGGDEPSGDVCTLELSLKDSYGDGWSGCKIVVANGGTSKDFTISSGNTAQYTCDVVSGTSVTLSFVCGSSGAYSYPTECTWTIKYQDGDDIWSGTGSVDGSSHTFTASCEAAVMPEIPTGLVATAESHKVISLQWEAAENAKKYNVYQEGELIASEITETSYVIESGIQAQTEYCFTVTAINGALETEHSDEICVTTPERVILPGPQEQEIGKGSTTGNSYLPAYTYYGHSYSQQIYTKDEIDFVPGAVTKIAFKQKSGSATRNFKIYLANTTENELSGGYGWVSLTEEDLYFEGQVTYPGADQWLVINLSEPFQYEGNNILVAVDDDLTSGYPSTQFYAYTTTSRSMSVYSDGTDYSISNTGSGTVRGYNSQVIFTIEVPVASVDLSVDNVALGDVRMGNYWSEKEQAYTPVSVMANYTTITEISCDNDFFTLSTIDYNQNPIEFNVSFCNTLHSSSRRCDGTR